MIHCFSINDTNIVLDVHSGALHVLDDIAYGILTGKGIESAEVQAEIDSLIAQGKLYSKAPDKEAEISFTQNREPVLKALCMHISHACNLRCKYCFASDILEASHMSAETGRKAVDFLIKNSGKRRNLEIDFFGGEPTINFETVKAVVEYARSREAEAGKNFRFTLTTNGLLLDDDKIEYANKHMDNVVLSLDGRKEVNDNMRGTCYDTVLPKFKKLVESRNNERYYMRGTYTRENLDFSKDVLHMADLGFGQLSVEPVIAPLDAPYSIRQEDVPVLCKEYENLAIEMRDRDFNFFHFMLDLTNGPCVAKRITGCGAGTEYLALTPEGDLYPCHQFVGDKQFRLGSLDEGIIQTAWQEKFSHCNVYTKPECDDCWAKYFCSGGCAANAYYINGDIMKPDEIACELQKKRLECALYLLAERKL